MHLIHSDISGDKSIICWSPDTLCQDLCWTKTKNQKKPRWALSGIFSMWTLISVYGLQHPLSSYFKGDFSLTLITGSFFLSPWTIKDYYKVSLISSTGPDRILGCNCGRIIFWDVTKDFLSWISTFWLYSFSQCIHCLQERLLQQKSKEKLFKSLKLVLLDVKKKKKKTLGPEGTRVIKIRWGKLCYL